MALRERKSGSWEVYYRNPYTGKRESFSVSCKTEGIKEDALIRYRIKFEPEYFKERAVVKVDEIQEDFESMVYSYLASRGYTKENLYKNIHQLRIWLDAFGKKPVKAITEKEILNIMNAMSARGLKNSTIGRRMASVKAIFRWAEMQGKIERAPRLPSNPKVVTPMIIPPSPEEILELLRVASPHIKRVIIIGSQFGLRVGRSELLSLRWEDIDLKRGILRCKSSLKNPKG